MKEQSVGKVDRIVIFDNLTKLTICQFWQFWGKKRFVKLSFSLLDEEFAFSWWVCETEHLLNNVPVSGFDGSSFSQSSEQSILQI